MKISYRTTPILELFKKDYSEILVHDVDFASYQPYIPIVKKYWKEIKDCSENIQILTQPFVLAILENRKKLMTETTNELFVSVIKEYSKGIVIFNKKTYIYKFLDQENYIFFAFENNLLANIVISESGNLKNWMSFSLFQIPANEQNLEKAISLLKFFMSFIVFVKYAPIEIKEVGAGKRLKDINCKYANDTQFNVQILDSTWFTTLVKSEGFKVKGHFRLQPCGQGLNERKLIWISDFEKNGYTRHFKRPVNIKNENNVQTDNS